MIMFLLIVVPILLIGFLYAILSYASLKSEGKMSWGVFIGLSLVIISFSGLLLTFYLYVTSDNFDPYKNYPSIYDDSFRKDYYGGTKYYPNR